MLLLYVVVIIINVFVVAVVVRGPPRPGLVQRVIYLYILIT
jgi:hypothetical protein